MKEATAKISKEADPAKAKEMLDSLEQALRTGDLFADMQVKAALTAYTQNRALYEQLKKTHRTLRGSSTKPGRAPWCIVADLGRDVSGSQRFDAQHR